MRHTTSLTLLLLALTSYHVYSNEIESSIDSSSSAAQQFLGNPLRFFGLTKTLATTTTVLSTTVVFVRQTCTVVASSIPPCSVAPPTTTTTTTTPLPTTTTPSTTPAPVTSSTSPAPTTPKLPFIQILPGGSSPLFSGSININKVNPPKVQFNLPQISNPLNGINASGLAGLGNLFNKQPVSISLAAGVSASVTAGDDVGRKRRSELIELASLQPSIVRAVEMTAIPDMNSREAFVREVETSQLETSEQEYEIHGVFPQFAERAFPFAQKITLVKLDRVTVTATQTVTSNFPIAGPTDRVTLAISGCVPTNLPSWPSC